MAGFQSPGSRYVTLLGGMPNANNGTVTGGLGHVLQQFLMGRSGGQDRRDQEAAQGIYSRALQEMQGTPERSIGLSHGPDSTGEQRVIPAVPGNFSAALQTLGSNPYTADYAMQLQVQQMQYEQQMAAEEAAAGNELVEVSDGKGGTIFMPRSEVGAGTQVDMADPVEPKYVKLADGVYQAFPDGTKVRMGDLPPTSSTNVVVEGDVPLDRGQTTLFGFNEADTAAAVDSASKLGSMVPFLDQAEAALASIPEGSMLSPGVAFPETRMVIARMGEGLGMNVEGLDGAELLTAVNNRMAPEMRIAGSGSTSDMEFTAFRLAAPGMLNSREGNLRIISMYREMAAFAQATAQIKKQALVTTANNPGDYDAEVARLMVETFGSENPSIGPTVAAFAAEQGGGAPAATGEPAWPATGTGNAAPPASFSGTPEEWQFLSEEDRALWGN